MESERSGLEKIPGGDREGCLVEEVEGVVRELPPRLCTADDSRGWNGVGRFRSTGARGLDNAAGAIDRASRFARSALH